MKNRTSDYITIFGSFFLLFKLLLFRKGKKSKFLLSQALKWKKKNMFFVIPEMPSKTFVMILKDLPDHFKFVLLKVRMGRSGRRDPLC